MPPGGIIGSLPALNARSSDIFEIWMAQMAPQAGELGMAPYAINIIVHHSNPRLEADLSIAARYEAPIIIASVGNPAPVVERVKVMAAWSFPMSPRFATPDERRRAVQTP